MHMFLFYSLFKIFKNIMYMSTDILPITQSIIKNHTQNCSMPIGSSRTLTGWLF